MSGTPQEIDFAVRRGRFLLHAQHARFERSSHTRRNAACSAPPPLSNNQSGAVSCRARHVAADVASFAATFLLSYANTLFIRNVTARPLRHPLRFASLQRCRRALPARRLGSFPQATSLQRKIARFPRVPWSRSVHLFACKRAHDGSLSLPTFCGRACGTILIARSVCKI